MLHDLEADPRGLATSYDICIVGAGPAGITLARELGAAGCSVLLAESGGLKSESRSDDLNHVDSVGHPARLREGRFRIFGGSATKWGGRCAMLDEIDFERRDWVAQSGWPMRRDDLAPYYERAKAILNFDRPWCADEEGLRQLGVETGGFGEEAIRPFVWRVPPPFRRSSWLSRLAPRRVRAFDFADVHGRELFASPTVHVLLHATLSRLCSAPSGRSVASVELASLNGRSISIRARYFVLCCSGIENARILLNAPAAMLAALNAHDNVGRYLAQHPGGAIAHVRTGRTGALRLQRTFNIFQRPPRAPVEYAVGLALSERAQRENGLLNASVAWSYEAREGSSWAAFKRLKQAFTERRAEWRSLRDLATALRALPLRNLCRRFVLGREIYLDDPSISALVNLEQAPNRDSRVYLGPERDAFGVRRAVVDWRISDAERRTARFFAAAIARDFERLGLGKVERPDWLDSNAPLTEDQLAGNYHHIGTTRMSADPRDGVVDADCRVHGSENLFVAGASVFPTGGHANPTLTIVALSVRLADHLRELTSRPADVADAAVRLSQTIL